MAIDVTTVAFTQAQKDAAADKTNSAERISSLFGAVTTNVDASMNEVEAQINTNTDDITANTNSITTLNADAATTGSIDSKIAAAKLALGTNCSAADAAARDALTGLTVGDVIHTVDAGDGKWIKHEVVSIADGDTGDTATLEIIMDEDVYLNAQSAASIKSAYESNADTNAYTDAEVTKMGHITVTADIDLDNLADPSVALSLGTDAQWGVE